MIAQIKAEDALMISIKISNIDTATMGDQALSRKLVKFKLKLATMCQINAQLIELNEEECELANEIYTRF